LIVAGCLLGGVRCAVRGKITEYRIPDTGLLVPGATDLYSGWNEFKYRLD